MKIDVNKIPPEGAALQESVAASELDLETQTIKFSSPVTIKARVARITNALTVDLNLSAVMYAECGRCLGKFDIVLNKDLRLNYQVDKSQYIIDLNPDIREEIIVDYPIKLLCKESCKGLCPRCGKGLNQGGCSCATT